MHFYLVLESQRRKSSILFEILDLCKEFGMETLRKLRKT